jgi:hypothetical protein
LSRLGSLLGFDFIPRVEGDFAEMRPTRVSDPVAFFLIISMFSDYYANLVGSGTIGEGDQDAPILIAPSA